MRHVPHPSNPCPANAVASVRGTKAPPSSLPMAGSAWLDLAILLGGLLLIEDPGLEDPAR